MGNVPNLSSPRILAGLLRLEARRNEGCVEALQCLREAYDLVATEWSTVKKTLDDDDCSRKIPELVFEAAVKFGWVAFPRTRKVRRTRRDPNSWIPHAPVIDWVDVPIPDSELVEQIGRFNVEAGFGSQFVGLLAGRIANWQAMALTPRVADNLVGTTPEREVLAHEIVDQDSAPSKSEQPGETPAEVSLPNPAKKRGRPSKFSSSLKQKAYVAKSKGTNRDAAKILYGTTRPSGQQVKNVPTILRNLKKTRPDE